jgi:hypothetical protein
MGRFQNTVGVVLISIRRRDPRHAPMHNRWGMSRWIELTAAEPAFAERVEQRDRGRVGAGRRLAGEALHGASEDPPDHLVIESWHPGRGLTWRERT